VSQGVTQTASTTGTTGDELALILKATLEAVPLLGLPDQDVSKLTNAVQVLRDELVNDQPDAGVVKAFMQRTLETLGKAVDSSIALVLTAYAKYLMLKAGVPIE
jgi:hypothetical protein